jgi:hypothetical protein
MDNTIKIWIRELILENIVLVSISILGAKLIKWFFVILEYAPGMPR